MESSNTYEYGPLLLGHLTAGREEAFAYIYKNYQQRVYNYARRWIAEAEDAEDITADTFVKCWDHRANFESVDAIGAFLFVTVRNACYDYLRRQQVRSEKQADVIRSFEASQQTDFTLQEIREEFLSLIYAETEKMPAKMKEIFLLSYKEGLKPAEIAKRLHLSVQTVSNQKNNAINLLRTALANRPLLLAILLLLEFPVSGDA